MIGKLFHNLRWKLIALFVLSLVLSVFSILGLLFVIWLLYQLNIRFPYEIARELERNFDAPILLFAAGVFFFVLYVFFLTRGRVNYLIRITETVQQIANGRFDHEIPIKYNDELGELAVNLNKMAQQLKHSIEEERRAERTKAELITNVSHDLRTPLTSITGYLGLIEQDRYRDEVELRHYVHVAYEKSKRLNVLIDDLFEYTRLSGGGLPLKKTAVDLVELLGQLTAQLQYEMKMAGMDIRLSFPNTRVMVKADGDKLARVFDNLLNNAVNYGKDGLYLDVNVRVLDQEAAVEVVNYGEPIPPQYVPHIFDRFYRVEQSRSEQTGGSGLGLAIAKQIVELHGGHIRVESDRSRTIFEVRLPLFAL